MSPSPRALVQLAILLAVIVVLFVLFPAAFMFVEMAARSMRHLWWLILLIALGAWLIWGAGRKPK